jgi:hypothetical protein
VGRDGGDLEVIWVVREQKYFCERGWTQVALNSLTGKSETRVGLETSDQAVDQIAHFASNSSLL